MKKIDKYLSNRMKMIIECINPCEYVWDIGTDHGYIPIYLIQNNICKFAYATDVKEGPIEVAKKNITKYNLNEHISTRLGNGISVINKNYDTCVIAGMGGTLIAKLIEDNLSKAKQFNRLILQAMNAQEILRKFLFDNGFNIIEEKLCTEKDKLYNVMVVTYINKQITYKEYELYSSKFFLQNNNKLFKKYLEPKLIRLSHIINGYKMVNKNAKYYIEIEEKLKEIYDE